MKTLKNGQRSALCRILVEARTRAGLSQRQLARQLGRAHSYVAKIEAGDRRVEVAEFMTLARALGEDPKALLALVQDRQQQESLAATAKPENDPDSNPNGNYNLATDSALPDAD